MGEHSRRRVGANRHLHSGGRDVGRLLREARRPALEAGLPRRRWHLLERLVHRRVRLSAPARALGEWAQEVDPGVQAKWAPYPQQVAGCSVQRVSNPKAVRVFAWTPCAGVPACQQATFLGDFAALRGLGGDSMVKVTSTGTVIALFVFEPSSVSQNLFIDENGWLLDGFRRRQRIPESLHPGGRCCRRRPLWFHGASRWRFSQWISLRRIDYLLRRRHGDHVRARGFPAGAGL